MLYCDQAKNQAAGEATWCLTITLHIAYSFPQARYEKVVTGTSASTELLRPEVIKEVKYE